MGDKDMSPRFFPAFNTPNWRDMVDYRLRQGFGTEDIAIQMRTSRTVIQMRVDILRDNGTLAKWWPHGV